MNPEFPIVEVTSWTPPYPTYASFSLLLLPPPPFTLLSTSLTSSLPSSSLFPVITNLHSFSLYSYSFHLLTMSLLDEATRIAREFDYPADQVQRGVAEYIRQSNEGLAKENTTLSQIPTFVTAVPNGTEKVRLSPAK